jgi:AcrR family transcriptional regulator
LHSIAVSTQDTRARIVDAAIETIKEEGIVGTSARAIARRGNFNQALIFYHFGSIDEVMFAAIQETSRRRIERYREGLAGVASLPDLAAIGAELHREDMEEGSLTVLTQLMAGAAGDTELGPRLREAFEPWIGVVEDALGSVLGGSGYEHVVSLRDLGYAVSALFLGIELLAHVDPSRPNDDDALFGSIGTLAELAQILLATGAVPEPVSPGIQRITVE